MDFKLLVSESKFIKNLIENDKNISFRDIEEYVNLSSLSKIIHHEVGIQEMSFDELLKLAEELDYLDAENLLTIVLLYIESKKVNNIHQYEKEFPVNFKRYIDIKKDELNKDEDKIWDKLIIYYLLMTSYPKEEIILKPKYNYDDFKVDFIYTEKNRGLNIAEYITIVHFKIYQEMTLFLYQNSNFVEDSIYKKISSLHFVNIETNYDEVNIYKISFDIEYIFTIIDIIIKEIIH